MSEKSPNREWLSRPTIHPAKRTKRLDRIQEERRKAGPSPRISHGAVIKAPANRRVD